MVSNCPVAAARSAPNSSPAPHRPPFISVIVPVRNEGAFIRRTLEQLLAQDYDPGRFEVLVADGRSTDETAGIVRSMEPHHPNLRLLDNPRRLSSAGRNAAIRHARGDLILLVDGHCELNHSSYFQRLADAFDRSGADCVGRPQPLGVSGATVLQQAIARARSSRLGHHPDSHIYSSHEGVVRPQSVAIAYRRRVFSAVGLFDESFDACEDVEFNHRLDKAGFRCFFTPELAVHYFPRSNLRGLFRQMVRYGRGRVRLFRKHPETFTLAGFAPAFFLLAVSIGPVLALAAPWLPTAYLLGLAAYAATLLLTSLAITVRARSPRLLAWLPLVFGTIHGGAGAGILLEFAVPPRLLRLFAWLRPMKRLHTRTPTMQPSR